MEELETIQKLKKRLDDLNGYITNHAQTILRDFPEINEIDCEKTTFNNNERTVRFKIKVTI